MGLYLTFKVYQKFERLSPLILKGSLEQSNPVLLPSSDVIISALEKIVKAFEDTIQVDLIRQRWEEIKTLQNVPLLAFS